MRIEGKVLTLDNIEHDILRPRFKDPRVHFAVNCASKSCPPLLAEPYTGARLQDQLETNTVGLYQQPGPANYLQRRRAAGKPHIQSGFPKTSRMGTSSGTSCSMPRGS